MGMPRTNSESRRPEVPEVMTYWPTCTFAFLSTYWSVVSPVTLPARMPWAPPLRSPGSNAGIAVYDAVDDGVVDGDTGVAARVDGHRGVPGRRGARDDARRDQLQPLREQRILLQIDHGAQLRVLVLRRQLLSQPCAELSDFDAQLAVLRLGMEEVGDPVPAVAKGLCDP